MEEITEEQMNHKQLANKEQMISNFITELSNRNLPSPKFDMDSLIVHNSLLIPRNTL